MIAARAARLSLTTTALLVCDVQERFRNVIMGFESLVKTTSFLVKSAAKLDVPIVVTEQYPERFQPTVSELSSLFPDDAAKVFSKTLFSMCTDEVKSHLKAIGCKSVIICGLETHVCVLQTSLDLIDLGIDVHICVDGVSSQRKFDRSLALSRLATSGAVLSTAESLLFQLIGDAKHPKFKALQPYIKENIADAATSSLQCI